MLLRAGDRLPPVTPAEDQAIAADLRARPDTNLVDAPFAVRRDGRVLHLDEARLVDEGDCDSDDCARYRLDAVLPGGLVGVRASFYESSDYLIFSKTGYAATIGDKPTASPSGRYLFVGLRDDLNGESESGIPNSIAIWRTADVERVRVVDWPIVTFKAFVGWHGDRCVEFSGQAGGVTIPEKPVPYWLVEETLDWTLHDSRPPSCAGR